MTHMLIEVHKDGQTTVVTAKCGVVNRVRSRADGFKNMTAWFSLADCPECLEGINHAH